MPETIDAVFDGHVFRPIMPPGLAPNTRVRITVESVPGSRGGAMSVLDVAQSLTLDGPEDRSANIDEYLYGKGAAADA